MAGNIYHEWNGTILTITSDSGTSSADLKGVGEVGPRGPQGPAGVIIDPQGNINTSFYATETYVDQAIELALTGDINLENYATKDYVQQEIQDDLKSYYTKSQTDELLENVEVDLNGYATETYVDDKVAGLATESFVTTKIAEAQLGGGEGGDIDLSGYATKDDLAAYRKTDNNTFDTAIRVRDDSNNMYIYAGGIQGNTDDLWIGSNGHGIFSYLLIKDKPVATQEWVNTAISDALAALDGSEVEY